MWLLPIDDFGSIYLQWRSRHDALFIYESQFVLVPSLVEMDSQGLSDYY